MTEKELRAAMEAARLRLTELHSTAEGRSLSEDEQTKWDEDMKLVREGEATLKRYEEVRALDAKSYREKGAPEVIVKKTPFDALNEVRTANPGESRRMLVDANLRAIEDKIEDGANQSHFERVLKRHAGDTRWATNILSRQRPEYESAFSKMMLGREHALTSEERAAVQSGVDANGGYLLPTHLDPTIILTNSGTSNVIRGLSRVVSLTEGDTWNGVTSAGVTSSWDAELAEVSDDSPTFDRVSVPLYKAQTFVQASIEAFEDIAGLGSDVLMLMADARDRLEGAAHATGSGSSQPTGIFTALDANAAVEVDTGTGQTITLADIHNVYRQVPVRWRGKSTWLMHPVFALAIKALGEAQSASFSGFLPAGTTDAILGRPVVESDDAPSTALAPTTTENIAVLGDFSNYLIIDKPGSMAVEFIPHLFGANQRPVGARGWYAHWRTGADSINDVAFRLYQDGA